MSKCICDKLEIAMVARNLVATCPKPNEFLAIGIYNIFVNSAKSVQYFSLKLGNSEMITMIISSEVIIQMITPIY